VPHTRKKVGSTNLPEGTVHVFRDGAGKPTPEELAAKVDEMSLTEAFDGDSDGIMLGVLAVPAWMTPSDFLDFVAPAVEGISHLRIIRYVKSNWKSPRKKEKVLIHDLCFRDFAPNRSMVILKFMNPGDASEFIEAYNGKPFNSMEVRDMFYSLFHHEFIQVAVLARNMSCRPCFIRGHRRG
jgi:BRCA1-associated protein